MFTRRLSLFQTVNSSFGSHTCNVSIDPDATQMEKEEKRRKNMAKARKFNAGFQQELELRRKELEEEEL